MLKPDAEGLSARGELVPENLKGTVKPVKLTYLFDVRELWDLGVCYEAVNQEYYIDGVRMRRTAVQKLVDNDYPNVDLEEMLDRLKAKAITEHYN
jgi:hypothetical protein